jgi:hypothetical protein
MIVLEQVLVELLNKKKDDHMNESIKRYSEKNPDYVIYPSFSLDEQQVLMSVQTGQTELTAVEEVLREKILSYFSEIEKVEKAGNEGLIDFNLFTEEELLTAFSFTKEDIKQIAYRGPEKELPNGD